MEIRQTCRASILRGNITVALHFGELLEENIVLLEARLRRLEHLLRYLRADLLHELLESVRSQTS